MALLLAGSAVATAGPSVAAGPPTLAATLDIAGDQHVGMTVRLARPLTTAGLAATRITRATSSGLLTTAVLVQASGANPAGVAFQRVVTLSGAEKLNVFPLQPISGATVLPAGTYKFYLLAPSPSTMTVALGGQSRGTTRLRPTAAAKVLTKGGSPNDDKLIGGQDNTDTRPLPASTSVSTYNGAKKVIAVAGIEFDFQVKHTLVVQSCTYSDATARPSTHNCYGGTLGPEETVSNETLPNTTGGLVRSVVITRHPAGSRNNGITYRTTGVLNSTFRWYFWIEY